jgi:hypothetical protein
MEVLQKKLTYREFRELEFDDNDTHWYELINGELVQKHPPLHPASAHFSQKSNATWTTTLKKHNPASCFMRH